MNDTRRKLIVSLTLLALLATLSAGGFSLVYIQKRIKQDTYDYLTESARVYGQEMNTVIARIEGSIDTLTICVEGLLTQDNRLKTLDQQVASHANDLNRIAGQFDHNQLNATSIYVRFDPARTYGTSGFFHADTDGNGILERQTPTDLTLYPSTDREHVGWFYEPLRAGHAIWMNPYHNANLNIDMVSYIAPLMIDGQAVGVAGADINFAQLKSIVTKVPKSGKPMLFDKSYHFLVHEHYAATDRIASIEDGQLKNLQSFMETRSTGVFNYQLKGVHKIIGFSRLSNGWTVAVAMTEAEAFASLNRTVLILILLNLLVALGMSFAAFWLSRYLNTFILRNHELEEMVQDRTQQLATSNEYLKASMAELESHQKELTLVNDQLEISLTQLQETQQQLILAEKLAALGELVAGVAHEINTPLGIGITLNSFVDQNLHELKNLHEAGKLSKRVMEDRLSATLEALEMSNRNLQKSAGIVETFKMVAMDQSSLDLRSFHLADYLNKVLMNFAPRFKQVGHDIFVTCDETLEIITYPGALSQIISHLVLNSLIHGFADQRRGTITISARLDNGMVELIYADNGVGIPEENLGKVFNPFFSTQKTKGSAGLGLHIVYNLVTQTLKGSLLLKSTPGAGVTLYINFPDLGANTATPTDL